MLHHCRTPLLLLSKKSQPQSPHPGHCFTRRTSGEISTSTADRATAQFTPSNWGEVAHAH